MHGLITRCALVLLRILAPGLRDMKMYVSWFCIMAGAFVCRSSLVGRSVGLMILMVL